MMAFPQSKNVPSQDFDTITTSQQFIYFTPTFDLSLVTIEEKSLARSKTNNDYVAAAVLDGGDGRRTIFANRPHPIGFSSQWRVYAFWWWLCYRWASILFFIYTLSFPAQQVTLYPTKKKKKKNWHLSTLSLTDFLIADNNDKLIAFNTNDITVTPPRKSAEQLLLELEQQIKNEPQWPELADQPSHSPVLIDEQQPKNTDELIFEFETICNAVGVTPPASPPQNLLEGVPIYYVTGEEVAAEELLAGDMEDSASVDLIDELVRCHSSELIDIDFDDASSLVSDTYSSEASGQSPRSDSGLSPRSDCSSFAGFSLDDDEEWTPSIEPKTKSTTAAAAKPEKRKKRPYGRAPEEKKVRKKEQNKNAATRYRQKKKQQLEEILQKEEGLKAVNRTLQTQFDDVKREISYLKKLMREVLIAKGVQI